MTSSRSKTTEYIQPYTFTMTHYQSPNTNKTYELDVDDVGSVPHCTETPQQTDKGNLYATPIQVDPVYESPLNLGIEFKATPTERRESAEKRGRRSKINDIYEATNDETLLNGRRYTGYSYVTNTDEVVPRMRVAYDNPIAVRDEPHEYEESFRNSRFSTNVVYEDTNASKTLTIQGIRDIKSDSSKKHSYGDKSGSGKERANCVQIFTLLLSVLACLIGILALLVASGKVKLNDVQNETAVNPAAVVSSQSENKWRKDTEQENHNELLANYTEMVKQIESSKQNYNELQAKYNILVNSSKQNYTELLAKYNIMTSKLNGLIERLENVETINSSLTSQLIQTNASMNVVHQQLNSVIQTVNSTFDIKLQNVNNDVSSLTTDVEKLRNISKQMGPRGFNGTQGRQGLRGIQGLQGEPGIGNISACRVKEKFQKGQTDFKNGLEKVIVDYDMIPGWKVISAVCTTKENAGTIHTVLSLSNNRYKCTCAGPSKYSIFTPKITSGAKEKELDCGIIYWECPVV